MEEWLLLPGTLCRKEVFDPLLSQTKMMDLAQVTKPVDAYLAETARDAASRILAQAPDRFSVLAFSLGAFVALELAHMAGPRMQRMVLIGATSRADLPQNRPVRLSLCRACLRDGAPRVVQDRLWQNYVAVNKLSDQALLDRICEMAAATSASELSDQTAIALSRRDFRPFLADLCVPVLVIHGEEDTATPPERGTELAALLKDGEAQIIAGAGHFALMEKPAETAEILADWLRRKERF